MKYTSNSKSILCCDGFVQEHFITLCIIVQLKCITFWQTGRTPTGNRVEKQCQKNKVKTQSENTKWKHKVKTKKEMLLDNPNAIR